MHILFTTIYLLHKQKLNHGNYFEHELNMGNFVQDNEYDVHMYTKLQDVCKYRYLLYEFNLILLIFNLYNILLWNNTDFTVLWKAKNYEDFYGT
jgi:hypothetical protein